MKEICSHKRLLTCTSPLGNLLVIAQVMSKFISNCVYIQPALGSSALTEVNNRAQLQ